MNKWNGKRFSIYDSEEKQMIGLVKKLGDQTNYNTDELENKTDKNGNHLGSWQGVEKPTMVAEGITTIVDQYTKKVEIIDNNLINFNNDINNQITEVKSSIETKVGKDYLFTMANMGQDVKEALTGGSVAVVGLGSVNPLNFSGDILTQIGKYEKIDLVIQENTHYRNEGNKAVANTSSNLYHSAVIPVKTSECYKLDLRTQSLNQTGIIYIDDQFNIIKTELKGTGNLIEYFDYHTQVPEGATNMIISTYQLIGNIANFKCSELIGVSIASKEYVTSVENPYQGEIISFIGDSLTDKNYNLAYEKRYPKLLCERLGALEYNYAKASATVCTNELENDVFSQISQIPLNSKLVIFRCGTNDFFYGRNQLGVIEDETKTTFYGALKTAIMEIKKRVPKATIIVTSLIYRKQGSIGSPYSRNVNNNTIFEYNKAIEEVCEMYNVVYNKVQANLYPYDVTLAKIDYVEQESGGTKYYTHLNDSGNEKLFVDLIRYI